jgi:hypothetical protein
MSTFPNRGLIHPEKKHIECRFARPWRGKRKTWQYSFGNLDLPNEKFTNTP